MSGEIGWCFTISKMHCICAFYFREASSIDVSWCGLQPLACFLASENGAFDAGIGSVMRLSSRSCRRLLDVRIAALAAAMVWVCSAVSKVALPFSSMMIWLQTSLLAWWFSVAELAVFGRARLEYFTGRLQALAGNRRHFYLLRKLLGKLFLHCLIFPAVDPSSTNHCCFAAGNSLLSMHTVMLYYIWYYTPTLTSWSPSPRHFSSSDLICHRLLMWIEATLQTRDAIYIRLVLGHTYYSGCGLVT